MKWLIVGAGALGSILAAHLTVVGEDVTLLARGGRARHLRERGLKLTGLHDIETPVNVTEDPTVLHEADVLILAVKTYDTEAALAPLCHIKAGSAFSVQNGMAKDDQLAAAFGRGSVLGCAADFSGEVQPDGSVLFTRNEGLYIGEFRAAGSPRLAQIEQTLAGAGIRTEARSDIASVEWSKLIGWLALTPAAVLTRFVTPRVLEDADLARLQAQLAKEAAQITTQLGIPLLDLTTVSPALTLTTTTDDAWVEQSRRNGEAMTAAGLTTHKMSALQDLERGRRLELDETFGYVVGRAQELGIALPRLETCFSLLQALDRNHV